MKYLSILLIMFTCSLGANEKLIKAIPKDCNIVMGAKVSELLKLPIVKESLKNMPKPAESEAVKPENVKGLVIGIKAQSEMELAALSTQPQLFMALETTSSVKIADIIKMVSGETIKMVKKSYQNKEYYEGESQGQIFGVHQISDKFFIVGSEDLLKKGIAISSGAEKNVMENAVMKKLLKVDGGLIYAGGFLTQSPDFKGFALLANYDKGIKLNTKIYCKKAEKASELALQAQALLPMVTANPEMGIKPEDIKISANGTSLSVSAFISENTLKMIPMMIQSMFMGGMPQQ